jgi:hypothetical protein
MKVQCRSFSPSVHSTNATWQTSFGLSHPHSFIFSAVSASPQRDAFFSGRLVKGQLGVASFLNSGKISSRLRAVKPFLTFAT